jgi:nucleoside-diphosphate-sugar epimerase
MHVESLITYYEISGVAMTIKAPRVAVVSGASGFLGSALCEHLNAEGYEVRALVREPDESPSGMFVRHRCSLPDELDESAFQGAEFFIHCAFDTRFRSASRSYAVNVTGSQLLFGACRRHRVGKIVFVSSLSAHQDAISVYGRTKLAVEALLDTTRDIVIRPGHIVGEGGVFWRTAGAIASLPAIPLFFGGQQRIQSVAVADVCRGVEIAMRKDLTGTLGIAELEPVSLREIYGEIARALGKKPRFVRLPGQLAFILIRIMERVGISLPLSSENLAGLKRLRTFDLEEDARKLEMTPLTFADSLRRIRWDRIGGTHGVP